MVADRKRKSFVLERQLHHEHEHDQSVRGDDKQEGGVSSREGSVTRGGGRKGSCEAGASIDTRITRKQH